MSAWETGLTIVTGGATECCTLAAERDARDEEVERLQGQGGRNHHANELLYAKVDMLESGRPLAGRRSRK